MGGLGIAFRRRTQYKKKVEKIEIDIYNAISLVDNAQILLSDIMFEDYIIEAKIAYAYSNTTALYMRDLLNEKNYVLTRTKTGSYKGASNGATSDSQYFLSGMGPFVHRWAADGFYLDNSLKVTQARTPRSFALLLNSAANRTTWYYIDVYDSTGTSLLHSLKPALLNKETPGLWDEVNQKFYGMTSETGTLTLA